MKLRKFAIEECKAEYKDIKYQGKDSLNFHDKYIYVLRKEGHYDLLYHNDHIDFPQIEFLSKADHQFHELYITK